MFGRRAPDEIDARMQLFGQKLADFEHRLSTSSSTALLVRINELEAALEQLQKSNRREFGKLWKVAWNETGRQSQNATPEDDMDPELRAFLDLQRAHGSD